jgi:probable F420-dependent oxidoreductase
MTRPFRFAVRSSHINPVTGSARPGSSETATGWRDRARRIEDLGYSTFLVSDHVAGPGVAMEKTGHPPAGLAVSPALMALAAATTRLRVGSRVACIDYHHPVVLAKEMATIDLLSDGRLEVGLGAGWLTGEYEALGIPFEPAGTRIERLDEAVTLLKQLFQEGPVTFHGKHFHAEGFEGSPRPVQRPHPPITIGGGSRRVLELAGRQADIVSLNYDNSSGLLGSFGVQSGTAARTEDKLGWISQGAGERIDEVEIEIGVYFAAVTPDPLSVAEQLGARFGLSGKEMMIHPHALFGSVDHLGDELQRRREDYNISYFSIPESLAEEFAPVVEHLAGK